MAQVWCVCGYVLWLRPGPLLLYQCAIHLVPDVQGCRFLTSGMLLVNGSCTASHALQIADVLLLVLNVHDSERKVRCPKTSALCQGTRSAIAETAAFCRCLPGSTARDIRTEPCLAALWPIAELVGEAHEIKFPKSTWVTACSAFRIQPSCQKLTCKCCCKSADRPLRRPHGMAVTGS